MGTYAPVCRGLPVIQGGGPIAAAILNPRALALGLFLIGRVADHHGYGGGPLNLISGDPGLGNLPINALPCFKIGMGIAQRIGDEQTGAALGMKVNHFRQQPQLRHGKGTELQFKAVNPFRRLFDRTGNGTRPFIALHITGNRPQHGQQERARARGRIGNLDIGIGKATRHGKSL